MVVQQTPIGRLLLIRLNPGDDLLRGLEQAVAEAGIRNGAILSGVGSLKSYHYHVVATTNLPPGNTFIKGDGAFDLVNVNGMIMDGRVHAHVIFSDAEKAMGGHLEEGCLVLTFAMVVIAETPAAEVAGWDQVGAL
jgi:predicted DNA-binding protein with PD1-like motif